MKRKIAFLFLALAMAMTTLSSCTPKSPGTEPAPASSPEAEVKENDKTMDDKTETVKTIKMLTEDTGGKDAAETELFAKALGEATGYEVTIEKPSADYFNILMQKLQSNELYDLIYFTQKEYPNLIEQGALVDMTDYVKGSDVFQNNVDAAEWEAITVDGKIYAGFNKKEIHKLVNLNKIHLDKANIDFKTIEPTLDGYYNVLKTLKQNNNDANYYPFNIVLKQVNDIQPWMASAGLKAGFMEDADGKMYVPYSTDEAAPVWDWLRKLYEEELLDPACLVDATSDLRAKISAATQTTSVCVDWAAFIGLHNSNAAAENIPLSDYEIVSLPGVKTPDGSYMLTKGGASLWGIPVNAQNIEGAYKVLEYFATQEGGELLSIGIEGNDYTKEGGTYKQTEIGALHLNDHGAPVPIFKDFVYPLGLGHGMEEALSYGKYSSIQMPTSKGSEYEEIVGNWGGQIVKGTVSTEEGLKNMRNDLISRDVTDK